MAVPETLPGIITDAADCDDRDDVATRGALALELQVVLATCPSNREGALTVAEAGTPDHCKLGRPLIGDCDDCMLQ
jgi:hypothetical protein